MTAKEFQKKLLSLRKGLRVIYGAGRIDGLYIFMPRHPVTNPVTGWKSLGGIPSSNFFSKVPKFDFWDDALGGYNRGWASILRYLTSFKPDGFRPIIHRDEALRAFGHFDKRSPPIVKPPVQTWWAKKRTKDKYQLHNLPSNTMGSAVVNV